MAFIFSAGMSGCVTTTLRDGKPIQTASEPQGFAMRKAATKPQGNTNVRVELVPKKDNPEFYEYRVAEVFPNTVYSKLGIKSGDTLLSIDGKPVQTMSDAIVMPQRISSGDFNQILVRRKGKNILLRTKL